MLFSSWHIKQRELHVDYFNTKLFNQMANSVDVMVIIRLQIKSTWTHTRSSNYTHSIQYYSCKNSLCSVGTTNTKMGKRGTALHWRGGPFSSCFESHCSLFQQVSVRHVAVLVSVRHVAVLHWRHATSPNNTKQWGKKGIYSTAKMDDSS